MGDEYSGGDYVPVRGHESAGLVRGQLRRWACRGADEQHRPANDSTHGR